MKLTSWNKAEAEPSHDPFFAVPDEVPEAVGPVAREVSRLEESARWSSQCQLEAGKFWRGSNLTLGVPASVLGLAAGGTAVSDVLPLEVVGVLALAGAALTSIMTFVGAERRAQHAQTCGNAFHDIQDDARRLLLVHIAQMERDEADEALAALSARYAEARQVADIVARRFYKRAGRNIREGGQAHGIDRPTNNLKEKK